MPWCCLESAWEVPYRGASERVQNGQVPCEGSQRRLTGAFEVPGALGECLGVPQQCIQRASDSLERCLRGASKVPWECLRGALEAP